MGLEIREPKDPSEAEAIEEIQIDAWGMREIDVVPSRLAIAIREAGGCFFIAYLNGEPVGYVLGFLAGKPNEIYLHSHQVGVKRKYWGAGIGYQLKLKQREWSLKRGIDLIRWTFDPLLSRNAYFNFSKLGVINNTYKVNLYGEMRDEINKGLESDRFYVEWWLDSKRVKSKIGGKRGAPSIDISEFPIVIEVENIGGSPRPRETILDEEGKIVLVPIPYDLEALKGIDIRLAIEWRLATREVFTRYFSEDYIAVDLVVDKKNNVSYYVLLKEKKERILESSWWDLI